MKSSINVAKSLGVNPDFLFLSNKYKAVLSVCMSVQLICLKVIAWELII